MNEVRAARSLNDLYAYGIAISLTESLTRGLIAARSKEMLLPADLNSELDQALDTLKRLVLEGLDYGHFDCSIRIEMENSGKRRLTISAGKSYRFSISPEDLKRQR
jgi:hypothetical protein